jgi:hypothetical protein
VTPSAVPRRCPAAGDAGPLFPITPTPAEEPSMPHAHDIVITTTNDLPAHEVTEFCAYGTAVRARRVA